MTTLHHSIENGVALLRLDDAPLNVLGAAMRASLAQALERAAADPAVRAIVLAGANGAFSAGGDIREFGTEAASRAPMVRDVVALLDRIGKPVVAAIEGVALGGGLELAMACHWRVASASARLGLPEAKVGMVPSAGGTQRLPRLVPVAEAVAMILDAKEIGAARAKEIGLVDEVAEGDPVAAAIVLASKAATETRPLRRASAIAPQLPGAKAFFETKRAEIARTSRGAETPGVLLDCLEASVSRPFAEGQAFAEARWAERAASAESRALRHLFFAEREAAKIPGLPRDLKRRDVRSVAVIGAGTMGGGIAMCFANVGIPVTLIDRDQASVERGIAAIRRNYSVTVAKGGITQAELDRRMAALHPATSIEAAATADLVIEAVFERMELKLGIFETLERVAKPGAILASNTSTLNIDRMAAKTSRPADVLGMHFFAPANVMRLLEVVRGAKTADDVLATAMAIGRRIGKVCVVSGVCDGFIGNRMLAKYRAQTQFLMEEGATPEKIDSALRKFGLAQGPFQVNDQSGLDIGWDLRKAKAAAGEPHLPFPAADRLCELGRFGQKAGKGWYRYEPGSRVPVPDPEVARIVEECRVATGVPKREITDEEIVERCMLALAVEGRTIVEEGIALRASDIDVVYTSGYGHPRHRGGPMFWAGEMGWERVGERVALYARGHRGSAWLSAR